MQKLELSPFVNNSTNEPKVCNPQLIKENDHMMNDMTQDEQLGIHGSFAAKNSQKSSTNRNHNIIAIDSEDLAHDDIQNNLTSPLYLDQDQTTVIHNRDLKPMTEVSESEKSNKNQS